MEELMIKRLTTALVLSAVLGAPGIVHAAGPGDLASDILSRIALHACQAAQTIAQIWGMPMGMCP